MNSLEDLIIHKSSFKCDLRIDNVDEWLKAKRYDLSNLDEELGKYNKYDRAFNVFNDGARQADNVDILYELARQDLRNEFGFEVDFCLFDEKECEAVSKEIEKKVLDCCAVYNPKIDVFYAPMRGKKKLRELTGQPDNDNFVLGTLIWKNVLSSKNSDRDFDFVRRYAARIGTSYHHGITMDALEDMIETTLESAKSVNHDATNYLTTIGGFSDVIYRKNIHFNDAVTSFLSELVETLSQEKSVNSKKIQATIKKFEEDAEKYFSSIREPSNKVFRSTTKLKNLFTILGLTEITPKVMERMSRQVNLKDELYQCIWDRKESIERKNLEVIASMDKELTEKTVSIPPFFPTFLFDNYFGNALKYTPKKGKILLSVYCEDDLVVFDSLNTIERPYTDEELSKFGKEGVRFSRSRAGKKEFGLNLGFGLFMVGKIVKQGFLGNTLYESGLSKDIRKALNSEFKVIDGVNLSSEEYSRAITPYYRVEARIPKHYLGL